MNTLCRMRNNISERVMQLREISGNVYGDTTHLKKVMADMQREAIENLLSKIPEESQTRIICSLKQKYRERY